jgi:hypothetical protein
MTPQSLSSKGKMTNRGAGWRDQAPATHLEKVSRQALLVALNDLGEAAGRGTTIGQITRGSDEANAMLDRLALNVADYLRRHPVPGSHDD